MQHVRKLAQDAAILDFQKTANLSRLARGAADKVFRTGPVGSRRISARGAALGAGLTGTGIVAGGDAVEGLSGGWSGDQNLDWHRQRMNGPSMLSSLGATLNNPVQSIAAVAGGHGGKGPDQLSRFSPTTGQLLQRTWAPKHQQSIDQWKSLQTQIAELREQANAARSSVPIPPQRPRSGIVTPFSSL